MLIFRKQIDNLKTNHRVSVPFAIMLFSLGPKILGFELLRSLLRKCLRLLCIEADLSSSHLGWGGGWNIGSLCLDGQQLQTLLTDEHGVFCGGGYQGSAGMSSFPPGRFHFPPIRRQSMAGGTQGKHRWRF